MTEVKLNYTGIDFTISPVRILHVRGQLINGRTGQAAVGTSVQLLPRRLNPSAGSRQATTITFDSQGTFDLRAVAPGAYRLVGRTTDLGEQIIGSMSLDLSGDVENLRLVLNRGFTLPVRFTIEGRPNNDRDPDIPRMSLDIVSESTGQVVGIVASAPRFAGYTLLGIPPDDYRIVVLGTPRNSYIKSALLNGVEVLNDGIHLDAQPNGPLQIVVSLDTGKVDGLVLDAKNNPAAEVTAVLVPEARRSKRTELYRTVTTDTSGRFHLENVAPGDYTVFAWEDVESGAWQDPEFLRRYEERGRRIHVEGNTQASVEIRVIPPDAG